jgi:hypothetical protein
MRIIADAGATRFQRLEKIDRDMASPDAVVMLRVRFRYVSKAAILTVPTPPVSVENRSPA